MAEASRYDPYASASPLPSPETVPCPLDLPTARLYEPERPMPDPDPDALDPRRRRLLFRATHRGTHENDLMIGGFVQAHLAEFSPGELDALETLLEQPETDLADWLTGRVTLPPDSPPMLRRIRASVLAAAPSRSDPAPASGPSLPRGRRCDPRVKSGDQAQPRGDRARP